MSLLLPACAHQSGETLYNSEGFAIGDKPNGEKESDFDIARKQKDKFLNCYQKYSFDPKGEALEGAGFEADIYLFGLGKPYKIVISDRQKTNAKTEACVKSVLENTEFNAAGADSFHLTGAEIGAFSSSPTGAENINFHFKFQVSQNLRASL